MTLFSVGLLECIGMGVGSLIRSVIPLVWPVTPLKDLVEGDIG